MATIPEDVLVVLSTLTVEQDPVHDISLVRIAQQLDRKLYLKTAEVLEALGGSWNRKAKATTFPGDVTDAIEAVILSGEVETTREARRRDGFFSTPRPLAESLCRMADVRPGIEVYEPSAGEGGIALVAADMGAVVYAFERDQERAKRLLMEAERRGIPERVLVTVGDCFHFARRFPIDCFDACVMNPPFIRETYIMLGKQVVITHLDHVQHAFRQVKPDGTLVSVLPAGVLFRQDRQHVEFRKWADRHGGEITPLPEKSFHESGTDVSTVVLRIKVPHAGL